MLKIHCEYQQIFLSIGYKFKNFIVCLYTC